MELKPIAFHQVKNVEKNCRLQEYGVGLFAEVITKSAFKKAIKNKRVVVNGKVANTALYINPNDIIELLPEKNVIKKLYRIDLKIHYEDDYLAIVEKPAGIAVSGNRFASIQNALRAHIQSSTQPDATQPHPVHRLDYATSGLLIIGKTATARRQLHKMFEDQEIEKTYHAVTVGEMHSKVGKIDYELEGKKALTLFKVLDTQLSKRFEALNLVELKPQTGRMHQLRKHMLAIGNPIMGDQKYFLSDKKHQGYGLYLHATALSFEHPITHKRILINSRLPKKIVRLFPSI